MNQSKKGKGFPQLLLSFGPEADPGLQAVSSQVTNKSFNRAVGCHYFPQGLLLPSQPQSIIVCQFLFCDKGT